MIKTRKRKKNPQVGLEYLPDLIGRRVVLLMNNGYVEEILEYRNSKYRLTHKSGIFSFSFDENEIKSLDLEEGGMCYIDIKTI